MPQPRRRNRLIFGLMALGLLAGAALTASPAQAVDAVGPSYAKPAWDQQIAPADRFVVLTNWGSQAVLDKETGLVWERTPTLQVTTWSNARLACTGRTIGNRKGWRLPSVVELSSLIDRSVSPGPTLPVGHPFVGVLAASYWSAATYAVNPIDAWYVYFGDGFTGEANKTGSSGPVWCVRGGMNAKAY
jgi:hypothetical protein